MPPSSPIYHKPELDGSMAAARYEVGDGDPAQLHGDNHIVHEMYADNDPHSNVAGNHMGRG
ncbi:hypothetical protein RRF57_001588 [Xylaria bambusicola]|uniref:Uncharacterized protein n=1 Tax=Xylaria bambusicola TaxID=326684 RepID=A0AAN7UE15_9PEZI